MLAGCGYTTKSALPQDIRAVHVPPVVNAIDLSAEVNDKTPFRTYRPGLEVDVTNAVINRFIFDGTLRVAPPERADAVVELKLSDFRRDALRYNRDDEVQEYRLSVVVDAVVSRIGAREILWSGRVAGDTTFFLSGPKAVSEDEAAQRAVEDLARRIVDRTIEVW